MSIEADLKKDGIEVVARLDTLSVNSLAKSIAEKICKAFPRAHFSSHHLFIELCRLPMYIARIPAGFSEASYCYENSSIYFKEGVPFDELEKVATHEFIHFIQEVKDHKNTLMRLGLCEFSEFRTYGMALNEGAVQLATSKVLGNEQDIVKYFDISLPTNSSAYYPLLCNLVEQLAYFVGEDCLFDSTLFSTNDFKNEAIELFGKKNFFKIQDNLDGLLKLEEKLISLNQKLVEDNCEGAKAEKTASKIAKCKLAIQNLFLETQNTIFTSYFDKEYHSLLTTEAIEVYRAKLYNYKNYIGITENYHTFNEYYINKMASLEERYDAILNNTALVVVKESKVLHFLKVIRNLFALQIERN